MIWVVNKLESIFYATVVLDWKNSLERNVFHITHTTCINLIGGAGCFYKLIERNSYWNYWRIPLLSTSPIKFRPEKWVCLYQRRYNSVSECKSVDISFFEEEHSQKPIYSMWKFAKSTLFHCLLTNINGVWLRFAILLLHYFIKGGKI